MQIDPEFALYVMYTPILLLKFHPLLTKNKCPILPEFWVMYTLIPKLKNNMQTDTLNFIEHVLFSLTIDKKLIEELIYIFRKI